MEKSKAPVRMVRVRGEFVPAGSRVEGRSLPAGCVYTGGDSQRAAARRLRQVWARFEKVCAKSDYAQGTRERLLDHAADQPNPEWTAQHLAMASRIMADDTGVEWVTCLNDLLNKFEEAATDVPEGAVL
jgi:hypothetical protein